MNQWKKEKVHGSFDLDAAVFFLLGLLLFYIVKGAVKQALLEYDQEKRQEAPEEKTTKKENG